MSGQTLNEFYGTVEEWLDIYRNDLVGLYGKKLDCDNTKNLLAAAHGMVHMYSIPMDLRIEIRTMGEVVCCYLSGRGGESEDIYKAPDECVHPVEAKAAIAFFNAMIVYTQYHQ